MSLSPWKLKLYSSNDDKKSTFPFSQVDGRNMYCKGPDVAAAAILGPIGTAVRLRFSRIVDGRQVFSNSDFLQIHWQSSLNCTVQGVK